MERKFTSDDALAAAETLAEISAGHREAAAAILNAARLDALTTWSPKRSAASLAWSL